MCKYLRASGERVLLNVHKLGSTCSVSREGIWASDWLPCPFIYADVWKVTGPLASHLYLCFWLLLDEAVETLGASEAVSVSACSWGEILLLWISLGLLLSPELVVQEILPVLFQRLTIADPFKAKQESQGALENPDEPPCYILWCSLLVFV